MLKARARGPVTDFESALPVRLPFGALFIKQRLGLPDEETDERIG